MARKSPAVEPAAELAAEINSDIAAALPAAATPPEPRHSYVFVLEVTPTAALTHGAGNNGNEQELHRRDANVCVDGEWQKVSIPCVSGAALKATLREHAGLFFLQAAGIDEMGKDGLRLVFKGGRLEGSAATADLAEARRIRRLFPPLSVFGAMDGAMVMRGAAQVSCVVPYSEVTVAAGMIDTAGAEVHASGPPIPDYLIETEKPVTYYRHDLKNSRAAALLPAAERAAIEDKAAARKATGNAAKEERREANESMPHAFQAIAPGTPMVATIRLQSATETEAACMIQAVASWAASGGHLGGASSKGHGACRVHVAHASRTRASGGPVPVVIPGATDMVRSEQVDLGGEDGVAARVAAYAASIAANAAEIRAELTR
jgi:hypothetical protein